MHWISKVWTFRLPLGKDELQWLCQKSTYRGATAGYMTQQLHTLVSSTANGLSICVLGYFRCSKAPLNFSLNSSFSIWITIIQPLNIPALQQNISGAKLVVWLQLSCVGLVVLWYKREAGGQLVCAPPAALSIQECSFTGVGLPALGRLPHLLLVLHLHCPDCIFMITSFSKGAGQTAQISKASKWQNPDRTCARSQEQFRKLQQAAPPALSMPWCTFIRHRPLLHCLAAAKQNTKEWVPPPHTPPEVGNLLNRSHTDVSTIKQCF